MLAAEGGRLVAALAIGRPGGRGGVGAGLSAGALDAGLDLGPGAADSYAHYGTLPVGLVLLAALVELGERSLPIGHAWRARPRPGPNGVSPRGDFGARFA